jgi:glutamate-1-semialdehyde 2,1-aminomutase
LATAAGLAALNELTSDVYAELRCRAERLAAGLGEACASRGFAASFPTVGPLVGMVCGVEAGEVRNFDDAKRTSETQYAAFFQAMLAEGVAMAPGAYEAIFVGLGHTDDVIDKIVGAASRAANTAA